MFRRPAVTSAVLLLTLLLPGGAAFALDPHQSLRHYGYQSWQTDSGLPQNTVHAVLQTSDGYIWLATEGGLVRFDSVKFTVFTHKGTPQLGSDLIYSLLEDKAGNLWIGTSNGVTRYRNRRFEAVAGPGGSQASTVWSLHQDRNGAIWALTSDGLARFDGARFQEISGIPALNETNRMVDGANGSLWLGTSGGLFEAAPGEPIHFERVGQPTAIQAIALDKNGRLWAGMPNGVEVCALGKCDAFALPGASAASRDVAALAVDLAGDVWIGTGAGLARYDGTRTTVYTDKDGLGSGAVQLLACDREGAVWAGTGAGIARVFNGKIEAFTAKEGFSSNAVLAILEDREGNLWLGTESGGIDILRDRAFTTYTAQDGISDDHIRSVYQDEKGTIWLGTSGGGLDRREKDGFSVLTTANGLSSNVVLSIASDANGNLWLGTPDGLDRLRDGKVTAFTSADGLADDFVRSLYFDKQGSLWIGTRRGLSQLKKGKFTTYSALDGLGSDLVGSMLQSRDGSLWICTLGGLTHLQNGRFTNFTEKNGLSNRTVTALHEDADGTLWIGTMGGGLNRWRKGVFKTISSRATGLPEAIYSILEDDRGNLWMSSNDGIFRASRSDLNRYADGATSRVAVNAYGVADGLKVNEASSGGHPAAWRLNDGQLWFATLKGVATVDPAHLAINNVPPLMSIEQMSVDEALQTVNDTVTIKPGGRRFAIDYTALSFAAPQKVRFKYRLKGFDHAWVDAGSLRTAYYTNLPPGRYTFEVLACNNDGVWSSAPAALSFRLKPFFYQTRWFYLLLLSAAALLWYAGYRWRMRQVESRFNAVMAERNRIAREIHDTLAQGFVAVSVQLQIVSRLLESSTESAKQHLGQAQELVRSGLEDARKAIWELRSQSTENQDLAAQLAKMADRVTAGTDIRAEVRVSGAYRPLRKPVEEELVRIAQEAVTNAVRHAAPKRVEIQLRFAAKGLELSVEDNGRGFSGELPSIEDGHFGITGMKERAQQIGGTLTVDSRQGQGTRVCVEVAADERE
ncbi:MAG TPA: two-component regulator propeller domain-containing protein [Silvibacterium sp.]|nr:two-component regulator propeller domain-containing protein [Silvibacterium sp.]